MTTTVTEIIPLLKQASTYYLTVPGTLYFFKECDQAVTNTNLTLDQHKYTIDEVALIIPLEHIQDLAHYLTINLSFYIQGIPDNQTLPICLLMYFNPCAKYIHINEDITSYTVPFMLTADIPRLKVDVNLFHTLQGAIQSTYTINEANHSYNIENIQPSLQLICYDRYQLIDNIRQCSQLLIIPKANTEITHIYVQAHVFANQNEYDNNPDIILDDTTYGTDDLINDNDWIELSFIRIPIQAENTTFIMYMTKTYNFFDLTHCAECNTCEVVRFLIKQCETNETNDTNAGLTKSEYYGFSAKSCHENN